MRITILGNSGSGKSTLARRLATAHELAHLDLDTIAWEPDQIAVPRDPAAAAADVRAFCEDQGRWVVEGCYASLVALTLTYAPELVLVDPGVEACVANCRARPWEPHKYPSKAAQDDNLAMLLSWVRDYETRDGELGRAAHEALWAGYDGPKVRLTDRATDHWSPVGD